MSEKKLDVCRAFRWMQQQPSLFTLRCFNTFKGICFNRKYLHICSKNKIKVLLKYVFFCKQICLVARLNKMRGKVYHPKHADALFLFDAENCVFAIQFSAKR